MLSFLILLLTIVTCCHSTNPTTSRFRSPHQSLNNNNNNHNNNINNHNNINNNKNGIGKKSSPLPQCSVYCSGPILNSVQIAKLYKDSKTFVDMPMKYDPQQVVANFAALGPNASRDDIQKFVSDNFKEAGSEVVSTPLSDWQPNPPFLNKIKDPNYQSFAKDLHDFWDLLGKKLSDDVFANPTRYSVIPVQRPFVVPGGRFREFYYWDTYWILKGLLVGGLNETAKGIIMNMLDMVSAYGFVPNGARIYYLTRSQPPLLTSMVDLYFQVTNDFNFVKFALPMLDKEYNYWMTTHTVNVPITTSKGTTNVTLNHFSSPSPAAPRPESYFEDMFNAQGMSDKQAEEFYENTIAGAESGWDFSSRWFSQSENISSIKTKHIVPVDLNAILYRTEALLASYYQMSGDPPPRDYKTAAQNRKAAMKALLWNPNDMQWHDYDLTISKQNLGVYPSNFLPLWAGAFDDTFDNDNSSNDSNKKDKLASFKDKMVQSLQDSKLIQIGGTLTSTVATDEQWDSPNAWAPLHSFLIDALRFLNTDSSLQLAQTMAINWIKANYIGYQQTGYMHEKYNAFIPGAPGNGGEYDPQVGFGWTNGVVLDLLNIYGGVATTSS